MWKPENAATTVFFSYLMGIHTRIRIHTHSNLNYGTMDSDSIYATIVHSLVVEIDEILFLKGLISLNLVFFSISNPYSYSNRYSNSNYDNGGN